MAKNTKQTLTSSGARDILIGLSPNASNYSQKELVAFITDNSWDAREVLIHAPNLTQQNRNYLVKKIEYSWDAGRVIIDAPNLTNANRNYLVKMIDNIDEAGCLLIYAPSLSNANRNYLKKVKRLGDKND